MKIIKNILSAFLISIFISIVYSFLICPYYLKIEKHFIDTELHLKHPLKVVHITDLHIRKFGIFERYVLKSINRISPDLVLLTGDFIEDNSATIHLLEFLNGLRSRYGIYGVLGNRDYEASENIEEFVRYIKRSNLLLLIDESYRFETEHNIINIIGTNDSASLRANVKKAMKDVHNGYKIMLSHSPDILWFLKEYKFDLILVGHTHGAQVNLPVIKNWILNSIISRKLTRGWFSTKNGKIYVNRGIGTSRIQIRVFSPPEIALFILK